MKFILIAFLTLIPHALNEPNVPMCSTIIIIIVIIIINNDTATSKKNICIIFLFLHSKNLSRWLRRKIKFWSGKSVKSGNLEFKI